MPGPGDAYLGAVLNGRYRLDAHLDDGHFSHVYRATDLTSGDSWAIKLLTPSAATSPEAVIEFDSEARLLQILDPCRNVLDLAASDQATISVSINGVVTPVSVRFHVVELADGALSDLLAHRHLLPWPDRLRLFRHVVAGAHQMHVRRVVHRDLKSSNTLLFDTASRRPVAKVSDLGRSCLTTEPPRFSVQHYVAGRGDRSFAPPELLWLQGDNDPIRYRQADVYLVGSVLFELATAQGITGMAIPNWHGEIQRAVAVPEAHRSAAFLAAANGMRLAFQLPLSVLAAELPPIIRSDGVALVKQLCDPNPARRERRFRAEKNIPPWGLEWVLRRVDIMLRNLELDAKYAPKGRRAYEKRKVV